MTLFIQLVVVGMYATWYLFSHFAVDPFLSLPVDAVLLFGIGYLVQRGVINRVIRAPLFFTLLLTFGINLVLINLFLVWFKADFRSVTPSYSGAGLAVGGITIPYVRLAALAVALLLAAA